MSEYKPIPYGFEPRSTEDMLAAAEDFYRAVSARRSVRFFSDQTVPRRLIELAIASAGTAPSGANRQPWRFVVVDDPAIKAEIRVAAEEEERQSYEGGRMPQAWLDALRPLGTDWRKPFLDVAPYLVVVFKEVSGIDAENRKITNYYVNESVGIATGLFLTAIQNMGLVTLTHTPSPMGFLAEILDRPKNEKPYLLLPVGYPAKDCVVPDIERKPLDQILQWNRGE